MQRWDTAVMAMMLSSTIGFLLSDGEARRVRWIQAMRRCLLRINAIILYEQPSLTELLLRIDLRLTSQERELTYLLHACARRIERGENPRLSTLFIAESGKLPGYSVLSREDRTAFENVLFELGRTRLPEQIRLIDEADERLRAREEEVSRDCRRRMQMMRTLGLSAGAALFLILI